jgi:hypothetical protein
MSVHDVNYSKLKKLIGIPDDEPIFILRAKDDLAAATIARYRNMADRIESDKRPNQEWFENVDGVVSAFGEFRASHPDLVRVPD